MSEEPEVFEVLRKVRYDLTAAQAKVSEALNLLSSMNLPAAPGGVECRKCGVVIRKGGERALALHMQNVHDGPPVPLTEAELRA